MEIVIALAVAAVAGVITASVATVRVAARDGYRRIPTRHA
jgi:hypothetical protein